MYDILFVDDDTAIDFLVARYKLWKKGQMQIRDVARNGKEALKLLEENSYDFVVTDIRMPVMDGMELLRAIREKKLAVRVILASNYSDFKYAREGLRLGAVDYIEKPYSEEKLEEALELAVLSQRKNTLLSNEKKYLMYENVLDGKQTPPDIVQALCEGENWEEEEQREAMTEAGNYLKEKLWEQAPWLAYMESMDIFISADSRDSMEMVILYFRELIRKYELWRTDALVKSIAEIIEKNIQEEKILDYLADRMELSKGYIGKIFRNRVGITLVEYVTLVKMEQAKKLLNESRLKVYEISEYLGYQTVDYFTRLFKSHTGYTPKQYRKLQLC